jgi:hypothetical protein
MWQRCVIRVILLPAPNLRLQGSEFFFELGRVLHPPLPIHTTATFDCQRFLCKHSPDRVVQLIARHRSAHPNTRRYHVDADHCVSDVVAK